MEKKSKLKNIFDLEETVPTPEPEFEVPVQGGAQKKEAETKGVSYVEIPKKDWKKLQKGDYIKYSDEKHPELRPFGVKIMSVDNPDVIKVGRFNAKQKRYFTWSVEVPKIMKLLKYVGSRDNNQRNKPPVMDISEQQKLDFPQPLEIVQPKKPLSPEDQIIDQIGTKILFDESEMFRRRIEELEASNKKMDAAIKKMFIFIQNLYAMLSPAKKPK